VSVNLGADYLFRGLLKFDEFSHSPRVYEMCMMSDERECADAWC
jgi:hypothetical protein